ncbi:MAG: isochorismatase family protein [Inhella sp.]|uniref:isochorismatase family protein n=1 Tax=Inhella sp. TaxID=1921806 RepID=UPI0022C88AE8|nr:isochorismatase family protein [Inhella sp.]MCZ8234765.1 isochorismatase family protein [Inhella sp.]
MKLGSVLLVVDMQLGAFDGRRCEPMPDGPALMARCRALVSEARAQGQQVIWVQHAGGAGGAMDREGPGFAIDPRLEPQPNELVLVKTRPSAFDGTGLAVLLKGAERVRVVGLQSDVCIEATALAGHALGLPMAVVGDGHHTWPTAGFSAEAVRDAVNGRLAAAGVRVD